MSVQADEATVRQFLKIISSHAAHVINGVAEKGVLQLCRLNPADEKIVPSRFSIDDVDEMVKTATGDAAAGHNVYIEARTVRADLRGSRRGGIDDTAWVFGLVADCDADKNKGGNITARPSIAVETSIGNFHLWYLLDRAIPAAQAKVIGDAIRANSGADQDTGVITQCYRVAGTPNFPSAAKRARGRTAVEPTRIFEYTGRLWHPDELLAAFPMPSPSQNAGSGAGGDEVTLPDDLLEIIRKGGDKTADRSALFHSAVAQLKRRRWSIEAITALLEKYPDGIAKKYIKRLRKEVERSYGKVAAAVTGAAASAGTTSAGVGSGPAPGARTAPHHHPDHPSSRWSTSARRR